MSINKKHPSNLLHNNLLSEAAKVSTALDPFGLSHFDEFTNQLKTLSDAQNKIASALGNTPAYLNMQESIARAALGINASYYSSTNSLYADIEANFKDFASATSSLISSQFISGHSDVFYSINTISDTLSKYHSSLFPTSYENIFDFPLEFWKEQHQIKFRKAIVDAGWLPHFTLPLDSIDDIFDDSDKLNDYLTDYFLNNWTEIKEKLLLRLDEYDIDQESKDAFKEALDLHEQGYYRPVCRTLFPEIERLICVERPQVKRRTYGQGKGPNKTIMSVSENILELDETDPYYNYSFHYKLVEHIYMDVDETQPGHFIESTIPNRHAVLHGIIIYKSFINSLNTIFMTDYIFSLIHTSKKHGI